MQPFVRASEYPKLYTSWFSASVYVNIKIITTTITLSITYVTGNILHYFTALFPNYLVCNFT